MIDESMKMSVATEAQKTLRFSQKNSMNPVNSVNFINSVYLRLFQV